jgi:hypothetical protein
MKLLTTFLTISTISLTYLTAFAANETVMYKKVDKDGNIVFTDKKIPGSKPIKVETDTNVVSTPKATVFRKEPAEKEKTDDNDSVYDTLAIDKPSPNQAVQTVNGNVTVIVGISPKLQPNHQFELLVDGELIVPPQISAYFGLKDLSKGSHTLKVKVTDKATGEEIQSSDSVTFKAYR